MDPNAYLYTLSTVAQVAAAVAALTLVVVPLRIRATEESIFAMGRAHAKRARDLGWGSDRPEVETLIPWLEGATQLRSMHSVEQAAAGFRRIESTKRGRIPEFAAFHDAVLDAEAQIHGIRYENARLFLFAVVAIGLSLVGLVFADDQAVSWYAVLLAGLAVASALAMLFYSLKLVGEFSTLEMRSWRAFFRSLMVPRRLERRQISDHAGPAPSPTRNDG